MGFTKKESIYERLLIYMTKFRKISLKFVSTIERFLFSSVDFLHFKIYHESSASQYWRFRIDIRIVVNITVNLS